MVRVMYSKPEKVFHNEADWGAYSMVNLAYRQVKLTRHDFSNDVKPGTQSIRNTLLGGLFVLSKLTHLNFSTIKLLLIF